MMPSENYGVAVNFIAESLLKRMEHHHRGMYLDERDKILLEWKGLFREFSRDKTLVE